jgi:4-amino-4-deoxy-L-arabinose transferase-like glycosyltransferase
VLLVVGLAIASRLALLVWLPMAPLNEIAVSGDGDTRYYVRLARHLESHGEYAQGHLRAYMPPGYPAFLSGLLKLGGDSRSIQVVQNLLYVVAVLMLGALASRRRGWLTGALAATLALASPIWLLLPQRALSETLFVALVALGIFMALSGGTPPAFGLALLGGVGFGLAALVREMGLLLGGILAVVVGAWAWREGRRARAAALAATVLLGTVIPVLPWTARNYSVLGQIVPISTNGPINLYIGNNPEATGVYIWRLPPEGQAVWNRQDEGRSNELFTSGLAGREALAHIRANPGRTLALVPDKLWALWGPPVALHSGFGVGALARFAAAALWLTCLALGVFGLWRLRREPLAWFIAGACLIGTLVHAVTFGDPRFRAAYEYLLMVPAGFALAEIWRRRTR